MCCVSHGLVHDADDVSDLTVLDDGCGDDGCIIAIECDLVSPYFDPSLDDLRSWESLDPNIIILFSLQVSIISKLFW